MLLFYGDVESRNFDIVPYNLFLASHRGLILSGGGKGEGEVQASQVGFHVHLEPLYPTNVVSTDETKDMAPWRRVDFLRGQPVIVLGILPLFPVFSEQGTVGFREMIEYAGD